MLSFPYQDEPLTGPPPPYPILGNCGCLQFFDPTFHGEDRMVEIETNRSYTGTRS